MECFWAAVGFFFDKGTIIGLSDIAPAPQDIMEEYNGCSVPQYTAYGST